MAKPQPMKATRHNVSRRATQASAANLLNLPYEVSADWVIEPEIPAHFRDFSKFFASPEYQGWIKLRRCFIHDHVEIWAVIRNRVLSEGAEIRIRIEEVDPVLNDHVRTFASVKQKDDDDDVEQRDIVWQTKDIARRPWRLVHSKIIVYPDHKDKRTCIRTGYNIPDAGLVWAWEQGVLNYIFKLEIKDQAEIIKFESPELLAFPWWAEEFENNQRFFPTNALEIKPLIDGESFFQSVLASVNAAANYIYISSWCFSVDTPLNAAGKTVKEALGEAASRGVKIYILLDSHNADFATRDAKAIHSDVQVRTSTHPLRFIALELGSYHDKYLVIDGKEGFCGGIDFDPSRYNSPRHDYILDFATYGRTEPFMLWHDVGVQVKGDIVKDMEAAFVFRWNLADRSGSALSSPKRKRVTQGLNVQLVRTDALGGNMDLAPVRTIPQDIRIDGTWQVYKNAIKAARQYIYIENQYIFYPPLGEIIVKAMEVNPNLQVILVIPFTTEETLNLDPKDFGNPGYFYEKEERDITRARFRAYLHGLTLQRKIMDDLKGCKNSNDRLGIYALATCLGGVQQQIYPHSKTMIIDDTWAIIGSSNANGRGFVTDGESNMVIHWRGLVTQYRKALWKEHLGIDVPTRQIREFAKIWKDKSLSLAKLPRDHSCPELHTNRVCKLNPPMGVKYEGIGSWVANYRLYDLI